MLILNRQPDFEKLLRLENNHTAEEWLELDLLVRPLIVFQEHPDIALMVLSGLKAVPPHQRWILYQLERGAGENVVVASRGTSKCLGVGTKVLMADGSLRAVEDIRVGDYVMGPDSRAKRVTDTVRGTGALYRIHQSSGSSYVVNEDHVLRLKKAARALPRRNGVFGRWAGAYAELTVRDFTALTPYAQELLRGYKVPVDYPTRPVRLDPYYLGLWLGDGTSTTSSVTTADVEVVDYCASLVASTGGYLAIDTKPNNRASTIRLSYGHSGSPRRSPLVNALRFYHLLGPGSVNKHIPLDYMANDETVRLALLAGLIDSDGNKDHNGYVFNNTNEQLTRDVKRLADSLGFRTGFYQLPTRCQNGYTGHAWRCSINGDVWRIPCRIARKQYRAADLRKNKDWRLSQIRVEALPDGPWAGFTCEGGLFMLEDHTVTHNSSTVCVLRSSLSMLLKRNHHVVTLSATGFRGGQLIFEDTDRWFRGGWDSQESVPQFFVASLKDGKINRSQNFWSFALGTSTNKTLPTKDEDAIRGIRANMLLVDEANTTERTLIDKVAEPFLAVKGDFEHGGRHAATNQLVYTTTIDFSWRPFMSRVQAARRALERDWAHAEAVRRRDIPKLVELERDKLHQTTFTRFDYTDMLIRGELVSRTGTRYRVRWPNPKIELVHDDGGIPFSTLDDQGRVLKDGPPVSYYPTYPVDKETLERSLRAGSMDEASWLAEQRNVVDTASGDVYPNSLIDEVCNVGDHVIYDDDPKRGDLAYVAPVLWRCSDPCVLGVDYAPTSDFCAFVVIRIGPLAYGEFDRATHHGKTPWSNVIWAEQHRKITHAQAADKIRILRERYNLVYFQDAGGTDPMLACRGIGLDMRGSGEGVRNALVYMNDEQPPPGQVRIYDPLDKDERIARFHVDPTAVPLLDTIWPSDILNDRLVEFTLGQMQQHVLYIGKYLDVSARPKGQRELHVGYDAMRILESQLRKIRQEPTQGGRRFYVAGSRQRDANKKDLFSAFLYAAKQVRAHLLRQAQIDTALPAMGAVMMRFDPRRGRYGRIPGARG